MSNSEHSRGVTQTCMGTAQKGDEYGKTKDTRKTRMKIICTGPVEGDQIGLHKHEYPTPKSLALRQRLGLSLVPEMLGWK